MKIRRLIEDKIQKELFKGKVIIIYGARRVGKTTLSQDLIVSNPDKKSLYLTADDPDIRYNLSNKTFTEINKYLGDYELIIIDEAQRIENIGITLKLLVDNFPNKQIIATGSSSFDLSNKIVEPLTGRNITFILHTISAKELETTFNKIEISRNLDSLLVYGSYPEVIGLSNSETEKILSSISQDYLFKDILEFEKVKSSDTLRRMLEALALQLGNEVSYTELANLLGINQDTVIRYLDLLEKAYIVFRLRPFSRNLRKELGKNRKFYFYDLGLRNALIKNFNSKNLRNDISQLWENFCIIERAKLNQFLEYNPNLYFWRTYDQKEIDYIEDYGGKLKAFEFKYNPNAKYKKPKEFLETYDQSSIEVIHPENYLDFLL